VKYQPIVIIFDKRPPEET